MLARLPASAGRRTVCDCWEYAMRKIIADRCRRPSPSAARRSAVPAGVPRAEEADDQGAGRAAVERRPRQRAAQPGQGPVQGRQLRQVPPDRRRGAEARCPRTPRCASSRPSSRSSRASSSWPRRSWKIARKLAPNDAEADYLSGVVYQRWQKPTGRLRVLQAGRREGPGGAGVPDGRRRRCWSRWTAPTRRWRCSRRKVVYFEHSAGDPRRGRPAADAAKGRYREAVDMFRQATILTPRRRRYPRGPRRWRCTTPSSTSEAADVLARAGEARARTPSAPTCGSRWASASSRPASRATRATTSRSPRGCSRPTPACGSGSAGRRWSRTT